MGMQLSSRSGRNRSRRRGRSHGLVSEINVTPLVDVMLVLLIVFMVAAPLLTAGVSVDLPRSEAKAIQDEDNKPIEITVTDEGLIYIGKTEVKGQGLTDRLQALAGGQTDRRIYIRGDRTVSYGRIMAVIGRINASGFNKVALISEPGKQ